MCTFTLTFINTILSKKCIFYPGMSLLPLLKILVVERYWLIVLQNVHRLLTDRHCSWTCCNCQTSGFHRMTHWERRTSDLLRLPIPAIRNHSNGKITYVQETNHSYVKWFLSIEIYSLTLREPNQLYWFKTIIHRISINEY